MNWYYVEAGQQKGPVSEADLDGLAQGGQIVADTLVWREGMANWQPYSQARPGGGVALAAPPVAAAPLSAAPPGGAEVVCAECGKIFGKDNAIQYGDVWVCANCKPIFVQKLKEGASLPGAGAMTYAGFWIRFSAVFVDGILLGVINMVIGLVAGMGVAGAASGQRAGTGMIAVQVILMLVQLAIGISYEVFFLGKFGATPGKMAMKIKVVTADGAPISYGRAFGRYFAKLLSGLTCSIGYIMAAFDDEKRALHDRICNTRVIRQ